MPDRVLLIEDDPNLGLVLQEHLVLNGFEVTLCVDGDEGLESFRKNQFDLCLVDVMMPRKDGFSFAEEVRREDSETPLIFLTAKSLKEDRIQGFRLGCDDYITKPFSMEELLLRVQAVLKRYRSSATAPPADSFQLGRFSFDSNRRILKDKAGERRLTGKESALLTMLCQRLNRITPRGLALREIWGDEGYFTSRSMDVYISKLRKYLKEEPRLEILSIHGEGFKLTLADK